MPARQPLIPKPLETALASVPSRWKRTTLRAIYAVAIAQRRYGEARLADWPIPTVTARLNADVVSLSCGRDRLLSMRMASSLLTNVGRPRRFVIVSDGTLDSASARALERLDASVRVVDWQEFCDVGRLPLSVQRYAAVHPLGKKLAVYLTLNNWPCLFVDSDVEFYRGASRLRQLVDRDDGYHHFQQQDTSGYDERLTAGSELLPGVNSGVVLLRGQLDWTDGLERLEPVADTGGPWTEQTVVAIALTRAGAQALPCRDYVIYWGDLKVPWDHVAQRDVVLRHYLAWIQRWKMWIRGGPSGYRTIPWAVPLELLRWWASE